MCFYSKPILFQTITWKFEIFAWPLFGIENMKGLKKFPLKTFYEKKKNKKNVKLLSKLFISLTNLTMPQQKNSVWTKSHTV